jgi:hypothetical protein
VQGRVRAPVVERDQDRMVGQVDGIPRVEAAELLQRDRAVARVVSSAVCLAKSAGSTA